MSRCLPALAAGLIQVMRSPLLVMAAILAMTLTAAPFALSLGLELQTSLANQQPIALDAVEIDPEWWLEFREHAQGLAATFTPAIIGFAAPLGNLSALLDGDRRPLILIGPLLLAMLVWAFLWGAALERFAHGTSRFGFFTAGANTFTRFFSISVIAALVVLVLYLTIHPLLFEVLSRRLEASAGTERNAFFLRSVFYLIFGVLLVTIGLIADYARVAIVMGRASSAIDGLREGARFVRAQMASVVTLHVLIGLFFVALLVVYGYVDANGGVRVAGWRGVAIAQAYIVARLVIRLWFGSAEVGLYRALAGRANQPS